MTDSTNPFSLVQVFPRVSRLSAARFVLLSFGVLFLIGVVGACITSILLYR